jgi:hypothetical protein
MRATINRYATLKIFESEAKVLGVQFSELKYLMLELLLMVGFPSVAELLGIECGVIYHTFMATLMVATFIALRSSAKRQYKGYMASWVSHKLQQPKLVRVSKQNHGKG